VALYRLNGRLDVSVLEHSLTELVRRHEVLHAPAPLSMQTIDLRSLPKTEREAKAKYSYS
jgi:hypothetical protein